MSVNWEKVSYVLGQQIGGDFRHQGIEVNLETFFTSFKEAFNGSPMIMDPSEMQQVMTEFQQFMMEKEQKRVQEMAALNVEQGKSFLADNAKAEGVQTLPSGLQYKVINEGEGKSPSESDTIEAHYEGRLIDGTVFDSSYQRGQAATFPVAGVIKGWTEALQLMKEGAKWQLFIPSDLAYGEAGAPPAITPNATLIFDVELLAVK